MPAENQSDEIQPETTPVSPTPSSTPSYGDRLWGAVANPDSLLSKKNVFDALDDLFKDTGITRGSREASKWYKSLVRELFEGTELSPEETVLRDRTRLVQKSGYKREGSMYLFNYRPKTRRKLKHYDTVPLVVIIKFTKDGFLGLNLHYLHPTMRERFFQLLKRRLRGNVENKWSRLEITYEMLKSSSQFRYYRPCIKRYKTKYIGSRILHIYPKDWEFAMHLPIERFKKKNRYQVWMESRQKLFEEKSGTAEQ
tara:strand:- start:36 stop:797 length:762 start_codon:yes stop_codon:yes gene_type:complete